MNTPEYTLDLDALLDAYEDPGVPDHYLIELIPSLIEEINDLRQELTEIKDLIGVE